MTIKHTLDNSVSSGGAYYTDHTEWGLPLCCLIYHCVEFVADEKYTVYCKCDEPLSRKFNILEKHCCRLVFLTSHDFAVVLP